MAQLICQARDLSFFLCYLLRNLMILNLIHTAAYFLLWKQMSRDDGYDFYVKSFKWLFIGMLPASFF
jgi:hypothetical protein